MAAPLSNVKIEKTQHFQPIEKPSGKKALLLLNMKPW